MSHPLIIAHRGAAGEAPENTLSSFQLALDQGCHAIELDIHLSADGELIVCHDYTIKRTTSGSGAIGEMTASELKKVDAGSWFHEKYAGEQLPLLKEVFDLVPPEIMINVEIKGSDQNRISPKLLNLMKKTNRVSNVVVSSYNHKALLQLKQLETEVKIGLLYTANFVNHRQVAELMGVPVYSLHPHFNGIEKEDMADAVNHGLQVFPYTINDEKNMKRAIDHGATGIITDYPARLKRLLMQG